MNKRLFHQNGFTRTTKLSTTVSKNVEENELLFTHQQARPRTLANTFNMPIPMHSIRSKHFQELVLKKKCSVYTTRRPLVITKANMINNSTFIFDEKTVMRLTCLV